jgi:hypothetical protein
MAKDSGQSRNDKLTISEHRSSVWEWVLSISLLVAILFLILFLVSSNPLVIGIFRLIAFIGFAAFVLAILQQQGKMEKIEIKLKDDELIVNYYSSLQKSQEELFDIDTIDHVEKQPAPAIWKIIPRKDCAKLQISFTDTPNILSLLRFRGRDLYVSHSQAQKAIQFLSEHHISSKVK